MSLTLLTFRAIACVLVVLCLVEISDIVRVLIGETLTRSSCLRFVGAFYASFSFAQSVIYRISCKSVAMPSTKKNFGSRISMKLGTENLKTLKKVWWFFAVVCSSFIFSGWCIYRSWMSEEDRPVKITLQ
ncbi:hypothetical protein PRIPAC_77043 [Pristionchus pacificus]|uniref:Uncharacterized protein n=1 Tax=Pristionchus pacificus TaxID=54126 RepID=A0A2A6C4J3_PRIPA|nr:hypothetical protein PRIPAC_77043 [Pristionchus pacificus]|eukprot:PDM73084.1 hypothetical protein PRIPAC_39518 [Pristionchus pacificus]